MSKPYRTTRRVEFADTDLAGIMHFSNFFRYMESAEAEFLRSLGLSVTLGWEGRQIGFPRVSASCDYLKPARFEDVFDITVRILKIGTKSITYALEFHRGEELLARGQVSSVCCLVTPDRQIVSVELPATLRRVLEQMKNGEPGA
jgi:acyl-CoA thioester hydrolase